MYFMNSFGIKELMAVLTYEGSREFTKAGNLDDQPIELIASQEVLRPRGKRSRAEAYFSFVKETKYALQSHHR